MPSETWEPQRPEGEKKRRRIKALGGEKSSQYSPRKLLGWKANLGKVNRCAPIQVSSEFLNCPHEESPIETRAGGPPVARNNS